jgi:hypothetical protein
MSNHRRPDSYRPNEGPRNVRPGHWKTLDTRDSESLEGVISFDRRRVFAVVSRRFGCKPERQILIFDNHPATVRLLNNLPAMDISRSDSKIAYYFFVGIVLLFAILLGMLLPVL